MSNGANSIHKKLRHDLEDYIKAQYFGKSPLLLSAVGQHLDDEGLLYQKPFIESSPAYKSVKDGIQMLLLPLESILRASGCTLVALDDFILVKRKGKERKLVVYPAMWKEPQREDTVYVSNAYIKYAKPYAVQKILNF